MFNGEEEGGLRFMHGLKFRETSVIKILEGSLAKSSSRDGVTIQLSSFLKDEAVWIDHEQMGIVFFDLARNAMEAMPGRWCVNHYG